MGFGGKKKTCFLICKSLNVIYRFIDFPSSMNVKSFIEYFRGGLSDKDFLKSKSIEYCSNSNELEQYFDKERLDLKKFKEVEFGYAEFLEKRKGRMEELKTKQSVTFFAFIKDNPFLNQDIAFEFLLSDSKLKKAELRKAFRFIFEEKNLQEYVENSKFDDIEFTIIRTRTKRFRTTEWWGLVDNSVTFDGVELSKYKGGV